VAVSRWHERVLDPSCTETKVSLSLGVSLAGLRDPRKLQKQSAAESLSTLQQVALTSSTPPKNTPNGTKRKRAASVGSIPQGRSSKRQTRREPITVTVKEHQFTLNEGADVSLYKLSRLWMDDNTSAVASYNSTAQQGSKLPPPEPHTKHSLSRSPPRSAKQSTASFDELISAKEKRCVQDLKDSYVGYGKVLRTWFHSQYLHRLNRYKERIRLYQGDGTAE